jgi:hypothetical protein
MRPFQGGDGHQQRTDVVTVDHLGLRLEGQFVEVEGVDPGDCLAYEREPLRRQVKHVSCQRSAQPYFPFAFDLKKFADGSLRPVRLEHAASQAVGLIPTARWPDTSRRTTLLLNSRRRYSKVCW